MGANNSKKPTIEESNLLLNHINNKTNCLTENEFNIINYYRDNYIEFLNLLNEHNQKIKKINIPNILIYLLSFSESFVKNIYTINLNIELLYNRNKATLSHDLLKYIFVNNLHINNDYDYHKIRLKFRNGI